jgi:Uma2 family endonuclease
MTPPLVRKAPATYADIEALPEGLTGQIVGGELFVSPRPANAHAQAAATLGMDLGSPFQRGRGGPGGWWIIDEPELHLAADVLVPDLAGWRRERLPTVPDSPYFTLAPDWICEVLSPSTARLDRVRKLPTYAAAGVRHAWIVDPSARTLEVFRLEGPHYALVAAYEGEQAIRAEPFDAVELELGALWLAAP